MFQAQQLLQMGLHPSEILIGYEKAAKLCYAEMDNQVCYEVKDIHDFEEVKRCIKACIASKQFGLEDKLSDLITTACLYAIPKGGKRLPVDNVRVMKILGGGIEDSEVIHGMACIRESRTTITRAQNCKVAVFNTNIEMQQGETKGTILFKSAEELESYSKTEEDRFEVFIKGLADAGIQVVVCSGSISEIALHFLEQSPRSIRSSRAMLCQSGT
jgi:T-complex protein 1 subunit theta